MEWLVGAMTGCVARDDFAAVELLLLMLRCLFAADWMALIWSEKIVEEPGLLF